MKPTVKVFLSLVLMLALLSPALADTGVWAQEIALDKFRRPTGECMVINSVPFEGLFSTDKVTDQPLTASIILDSAGLGIALFEHGDTKVSNASSYARNYSVSLLTADGTETELKGIMPGNSERILFTDEERGKLLRALLADTSLVFYIEQSDSPLFRFFFTIPSTNGFAEACVPVLQSEYDAAIALKNEGRYTEALPLFASLGTLLDSEEQYFSCAQASDVRREWAQSYANNYLSAGGSHTVGLKKDGTIVAARDNGYGQLNVENWTDIVVVAAGYEYTVGLKKDGTIVAAGRNGDGQCDVGKWTDIVAVAAGGYHTVGLKKDGTVVAVGGNWLDQCDVRNWTDIVAVAAGGYHTVGLKKDGTVVAAGNNENRQCNVGNWTDIVAVAAGGYYTVGLKKDGTVVAVGYNNYGQLNVENWTDIVAVAAGYEYTVGLKKDGTIVATGRNGDGQCDVESWTDIVAVAAGRWHTVGLKDNGNVVAVGYNEYGQCNVESWTDIGPGDAY